MAVFFLKISNFLFLGQILPANYIVQGLGYTPVSSKIVFFTALIPPGRSSFIEIWNSRLLLQTQIR